MNDSENAGDKDPFAWLAEYSEEERDGTTDRATARLEQRVQELEDAREEERLIWIVVIVALANAVIFQNMETWGGPLVIGVLEIFALALAAEHFGVEKFQMLFDKILSLFKRR